MSKLRQYTLYFDLLVSVAATLGSLYFSEIRGFIPCELCWFQRIFMYPLSILLGVAAYRDDRAIKNYVLPLSIVGLSISTFHYLKQKVPFFSSIELCSEGASCTVQYINWLG
ncbi:disulfide oxidoreductase, partial [Cutibacterium acnes]